MKKNHRFKYLDSCMHLLSSLQFSPFKWIFIVELGTEWDQR